MKLLTEIGVAGFDSWQITDSSGQGSADSVHEQVHAVGGQLGLAYVPWNLSLNFHYLSTSTIPRIDSKARC